MARRALEELDAEAPFLLIYTQGLPRRAMTAI
jgi:hypothetical protein